MATQSLYRRYRPRRFSELKGQDHVVRALRNAVINHREGQAYLFSGPRGTGKTTSARILAKVLNCENPIEGEPCCECASCVAVEAGTSYDVHELDAASNNGVEAMRDLIEKTMLGTPGRHKVYILDEVHMLSKAAEAALLKTLEEPPPHVVFVLATTDPQKVSETIRSRTQHLQFRLLPMDVLDEHVRWLIQDAHLEVDDDAIESVLRKGGGSARDTLSALELVASSGGMAPEETPLDEFVESLIEKDPGRVLAAVAAAIRQGREARTLTESLLSHLRDCFLCLMAPELVQLPAQRAEEVGELAERLGAAATVRALETLGSILIEMRHSPDPRVLLEVALVKLANPHADSGVSALVARIEKLEQALARGGSVGAGPAGGPTGVAPAASVAAPRDPSTGRAVLGGRARGAEPTSPTARPTSVPGPDRSGGPGPDATPHPSVVDPPDPTPIRTLRPVGPDRSAGPAALPPRPAPPTPAAPAVRPVAAAPTASPSASGDPAPSSPTSSPAAGGALVLSAEQLAQAHAAAASSVRPLAKAALGAGSFAAVRGGKIVFALPTDALRKRAEDQRGEIEKALAEQFGRPVALEILVDGSATPTDESSGPASVRTLVSAPPPQEEHEIDLDDLVDAPKEASVTGLDRITAAFPGAELINEES